MTFRTEAQARAFLAQLGSMNAIVAATTHECWTIVAKKSKPQICSICGESFREYPCNAFPINDGRCCAYCDDHVVTPARIALVRGAR